MEQYYFKNKYAKNKAHEMGEIFCSKSNEFSFYYLAYDLEKLIHELDCVEYEYEIKEIIDKIIKKYYLIMCSYRDIDKKSQTIIISSVNGFMRINHYANDCPGECNYYPANGLSLDLRYYSSDKSNYIHDCILDAVKEIEKEAKSNGANFKIKDEYVRLKPYKERVKGTNEFVLDYSIPFDRFILVPDDEIETKVNMLMNSFVKTIYERNIGLSRDFCDVYQEEDEIVTQFYGVSKKGGLILVLKLLSNEEKRVVAKVINNVLEERCGKNNVNYKVTNDYIDVKQLKRLRQKRFL